MKRGLIAGFLSLATAGSAADEGWKPSTIGFLVLDGVYNTELMAPFDVFQHVSSHDPKPPRVVTVALERRQVTTYEGLRLLPDFTLEDAPPLDILVVPSAKNNMSTDLENRRLIDWVAKVGRKARHVVSLCDGAFVLAKARLLDDQAATTFPSDQDRFAAMFPRVRLVRNVSFVDAGHALTSVGGAKSYDVAMYMVEKMYGEKAVRGIGRGLVIDWDLAKIAYHKP
jgi:transcriptional regulator GlxA family with amidase domain